MIDIYTDGASRGNPGKSASSFIFVDNRKIILMHVFYIGVSTNNVAEYNAIIKALEEAEKEAYKEMRLFSDSELVVKQIKGDYRTNAKHLTELNKRIDDLSKRFKKVEFEHIKRDHKYISLADKLCNYLLDSYQ